MHMFVCKRFKAANMQSNSPPAIGEQGAKTSSSMDLSSAYSLHVVDISAYTDSSGERLVDGAHMEKVVIISNIWKYIQKPS
jgi:hypothetical protein